jgi:PKD domain
MRSTFSSRKILYPVMLLALLSTTLFLGSCRTDEPQVPPLTGPSGARLFITLQADPEDLVIHAPNNRRETSTITLQLKNQQGVGVAGEGIKLRITNADGSIVNIGTLSEFNVTTDRAGFASVTYFAPNTAEQPRAIRIFILAVLQNPSYANEVTARHALDLEASSIDDGDCIFDFPGAPTPAFTVSGDQTVGFPVCFDAASSTVGSSPIVAYQWDFGDGAQVSGGLEAQNVCHTFEDFGVFNVRLLVKDANRNCAFTSQTIDISRGEPATCAILVTPTPAIEGETVNFVANVTDPDQQSPVRRFVWNFGDGETRTTSVNSVSHVYDNSGTFSVLLTITDDQGNISTCTATVTVTTEGGGGQNQCEITTVPSPAQGVSPLLVTFTSSGPGGPPFIWNFGDGGGDQPPVTSGNGLISHTFVGFNQDGSGTFNVSLTATGADPCVTQVIVSPTPVATQCNDGSDNDGDTLIDLSDPGCSSAADGSELGTAECDDGLDNDGDGFTDVPDDPGCSSATDASELGTTQCDNGIDDDLDTDIDFPDDLQCGSPSDNDESS